MKETKIKTSAARVAKLRHDRRLKGYVRREYYATPSEHRRLKEALDEMREEDDG